MALIDSTDLRGRLQRAVAELEAKRADPQWRERPYERDRLSGKAEGVRLALSYLDDAERLAAPEPPEPEEGRGPYLGKTTAATAERRVVLADPEGTPGTLNPYAPSVRYRRYAEAAAAREREARLARVNEDRAGRGLPPWENWRDEFYDPRTIGVLWFLLAFALAVGLLPRGVGFGWVAAGSAAATGLVTWAVRRTDPREKREG